MSDTAIAARGLTAGYGKVVVVPELNLEVKAGAVTSLLGPNGAGKTTTLLTLSGAIAPLGGAVEWNGALVRSPLHERARAGLGLVTEERAVFTRLTLAENLRVSRCEPDAVLDLFPELHAHLHRRVGLLSGGQQQMLALGCALAAKPKVLLADELSLGLAPLVVDRLLEVVRSAADAGVAVLLVEQHVGKVLQIADDVHVLQRGRIVLSGTGTELRGRIDEIRASYFAERTDIPEGADMQAS